MSPSTARDRRPAPAGRVITSSSCSTSSIALRQGSWLGHAGGTSWRWPLGAQRRGGPAPACRADRTGGEADRDEQAFTSMSPMTASASPHWCARPGRGGRDARGRDPAHRGPQPGSSRRRHPLYDQARARAARHGRRGAAHRRAVPPEGSGGAEAGVPTAAGSRFFAARSRPVDTALVGRHERAGLITLGKTNLPSSASRHDRAGAVRADAQSRGTRRARAAARAAARRRRSPPAWCRRARQRRRRLDPHPGLVLRPVRPEADARPHHLGPTSARAWPAAQSSTCCRAACATAPRCSTPRWAVAGRSLFRAAAGAAVPGAGRPAARPPAHRPRPTAAHRRRVHPDCAAAARDAAKLCADSATRWRRPRPTSTAAGLDDAFNLLFAVYAAAGSTAAGRAIGRGSPGRLRAGHLGDGGARPRAARRTTSRGSSACTAASRRISRPFFQTYDLLLTPTLASRGQARRHRHDGADPDADVARLSRYMPFTYPFNITGQPAMSVPLSWNGGDLPIGVQFVGRYGDEATLFRLAAQLEAARPGATAARPSRGEVRGGSAESRARRGRARRGRWC